MHNCDKGLKFNTSFVLVLYIKNTQKAHHKILKSLLL